MLLVTRMAELKRSKGVKLNGILECKFLSENAHRTTNLIYYVLVLLGRLGC
jgi:hypothetical protein